jgi:hypothetical protein
MDRRLACLQFSVVSPPDHVTNPLLRRVISPLPSQFSQWLVPSLVLAHTHMGFCLFQSCVHHCWRGPDSLLRSSSKQQAYSISCWVKVHVPIGRALRIETPLATPSPPSGDLTGDDVIFHLSQSLSRSSSGRFQSTSTHRVFSLVHTYDRMINRCYKLNLTSHTHQHKKQCCWCQNREQLSRKK